MKNNQYRTSSYCMRGRCVQVKIGNREICVRNSTKPNEGVTFSLEEWNDFIQGVKNKEFDLPKK
ncbi:MAG: DUF397 domain-containing protein [Opitutaceae bacterium]